MHRGSWIDGGPTTGTGSSELADELASKMEAHASRLLALARSLHEDRGHATKPELARLAQWLGLLELVVSICPEAGHDERLTPAEAGIDFLREGEYWTIGGTRQIRLRACKGLGYLWALLAAPGHEIHALDLVAGAPHGPNALPGAGPAVEDGLVVRKDMGLETLDAQATAAYKARLDELRAGRDTTDDACDPDQCIWVEEEIAWLTSQLASAYGLGGRRRPGPTPSERARQSVSKAIHLAIAKVSAADADLGAHLARTVRTGRYCCYDPDPGARPRWRL